MRLRIVTPTGAGSEITLGGTEARLGKDPGSEVPFDANQFPMVSNLHARIERSGAGWLLRHLSQSNKTLVNNEPVDDVIKLKRGDRIRLGYTGPFVEIVSVEASPVSGMDMDLSMTGEPSETLDGLLSPKTSIAAIASNANEIPKAVPPTQAAAPANAYANIELIKTARESKSSATSSVGDTRPRPGRTQAVRRRGLLWGGVGLGAVMIIAVLAYAWPRSKPTSKLVPPRDSIVKNEPAKKLVPPGETKRSDLPGSGPEKKAVTDPREVPTVSSLCLALKNSKSPGRKKALEKLCKLGPQARPALAAVLDVLYDPDGEIRTLAQETLTKMGPPTKEDVPVYAAVLRDSSPQTCVYAAGQLAVLGREARSELVFLRVLALDSNDVVQEAARMAVARIEADLLAVLVKGLQDNSVSVRCQSARELADMGGNAKAALPNLVEALADRNSAVRLAVLDVFWAVGPDAVMVLGEALRDRNPDVRVSAIYALGRMGPDARFVLPELIGVTFDVDAKMKEEALVALARIGDYAIPYLLQSLEREKNAARQKALLEALERIGHDAGPSVQKALKSAKPEVAKATAQVLKKVENQPAPASRVPHKGPVLVIQEQLWAWFKSTDTNKDGFLDKLELALAFRGLAAKPFDFGAEGKTLKKLGASDFARYPDFAFLCRLDRNNDGKISWNEFEEWAYFSAESIKKDADERDRIAKARKRLAEPGLSAAARKQRETSLAQALVNYQDARRAQHQTHHMEWPPQAAPNRPPPR